jgi:hypothetical protein
VFAPSNPAFELFLGLGRGALDGLDVDEVRAILDSLALDTDQLCAVLLNHVAIGQGPKKRSSVAALLARGQITVANEEVFPISVGLGDVMINYESEISQGDIIGNNGVIHFVKSVIQNEPPPPANVVQVFVTSGTPFLGDLGGLDGADAKCQADAAAAGLPGTWTAWLSDDTTNARDRIPDGEYQLVDGARVASSLADLTGGSLDAPINLTALGETNNDRVWTGTNPDGTRTPSNCSGWTNAEQPVSCTAGDPDCATMGVSSQTDSNWTFEADTPSTPFLSFCSGRRYLYCFGSGE